MYVLLPHHQSDEQNLDGAFCQIMQNVAEIGILASNGGQATYYTKEQQKHQWIYNTKYVNYVIYINRYMQIL